MDWNQIESQWKRFGGNITARWAKLTVDDLSVIAGKREALLGKLRERYGLPGDQAERAIDDWLASLPPPAPPPPRSQAQAQQSELDQERAESEGMGQARYAPRGTPVHRN